MTTEATMRAEREREYERACTREKALLTDLAVVEHHIRDTQRRQAELSREVDRLDRERAGMVRELEAVRHDKTKASTRALVTRTA